MELDSAALFSLRHRATEVTISEIKNGKRVFSTIPIHGPYLISSNRYKEKVIAYAPRELDINARTTNSQVVEQIADVLKQLEDLQILEESKNQARAKVELLNGYLKDMMATIRDKSPELADLISARMAQFERTKSNFGGRQS